MRWQEFQASAARLLLPGVRAERHYYLGGKTYYLLQVGSKAVFLNEIRILLSILTTLLPFNIIKNRVKRVYTYTEVKEHIYIYDFLAKGLNLKNGVRW